MITHRNLASNARVLHAYWGFRPDDVLVHMLPLFHVHGLFVACHCVLMNGTAMRFHGKFDARRAIADFARSTVFMGVPTFYTRLLAEEGLDRRACERMRLFVSGSAPLLAETHAEFEKKTGHRILERYGMTETGMLTSNPLDERRPAAGHRGLAAAGHERARRRRRGPGLRRGRDRPHPGQGRQRAARLLAHAGEEQGGVHRRRLLPDRRRGLLLRGRLPRDRRAIEGPHHHRRLQRLPEGGRARHRRAARGRGVRRDRRAPSRLRGGRHRRGRAPRGLRGAHRSGGHRLAQVAARELQDPEAGLHRERTAEEHDGEGPEERASRPLRGAGGAEHAQHARDPRPARRHLRRGHPQPRASAGRSGSRSCCAPSSRSGASPPAR